MWDVFAPGDGVGTGEWEGLPWGKGRGCHQTFSEAHACRGGGGSTCVRVPVARQLRRRLGCLEHLRAEAPRGGRVGRAVASLASSLAPGLGRNIALLNYSTTQLQLQQKDRTVQLCAVWRKLLIL